MKPGHQVKKQISCRRGIISIEALLALPLLIMLTMVLSGLIMTIQAVLILDHGLTATCRSLADTAYLLEQAEGLGLSLFQQVAIDPGEEAAAALGQGLAGAGRGWAGEFLARRLLADHLAQYPALAQAVTWEKVVLPDTGEEIENAGAREAAAIGEGEDVLLSLRFVPAHLGGSLALLPKSWTLTLQKQQRAWLLGRNILPERGLEQAAGQSEPGPLVYITRWGIKYHEAGCRYLAKSKIPAYLNKLAAAYEGCQVCRPPARQGN